MDRENFEDIAKLIGDLKTEIKELKELLADFIFLLAVESTETMQVTENTSALLRGEVPTSCKTAHFRLREHIVQIASRWNKDRTLDLKKHLFGHD
jgi:hypothetical protein